MVSVALLPLTLFALSNNFILCSIEFYYCYYYYYYLLLLLLLLLRSLLLLLLLSKLLLSEVLLFEVLLLLSISKGQALDQLDGVNTPVWWENPTFGRKYRKFQF